MNPYEGLNLPQLLDLLHDIMRPETVAWTPLTVGWGIAAFWLAVVLVLVGWNRYGHWHRNRYRREALAVLQSIEAAAADNPVAAAGDVAALLKRTAMVAYPRPRVANLYGADWARFLRESSSNDPDVTAAAERLATAAYRADADAQVLIAPARRWIKVHRA